MNCDFYIYFLLLNKEIVYVGKGKKQRSKNHLPLLLENKHINTKLQNKFNKYIQNNATFEDVIVYDKLSEEQSFQYEKELIQQIGLENLCNLTIGGEGGDCITNNPRREEIINKSAKSRIGRKASQETIEKIKIGRKNWQNTEEYKVFLKKMSSDRIGEKNPMYGKKEDEEHKKERMKNCLSKSRWNKGLTKEKDSRLSGPKGKLPHNAKKIFIKDLETGKIFEFVSISSFYKHIKEAIGKCNTKKAYALAVGKIKQYEKWILNG